MNDGVLKEIITSILAWFTISSGVVLADGGYFGGQAADLAQRQQQVLLVLQPGKVTYVLQTVYSGSGQEFAWIVPLPAAPTDVLAHDNSSLFTALDEMTRPKFAQFFSVTPWPMGCCACAPALTSEPLTGLVSIEAGGQAGIYDWTALTSNGRTALPNSALPGNRGFTLPVRTCPVSARTSRS